MTRDPFFDNAKYLLSVLVVFGHALEPLLGGPPELLAAYSFVYLFHMPCFVVVAGALTAARPGGAAAADDALRLLVPLFLFHFLYVGFAAALGSDMPYSADPRVPFWMLWFLPSLFCWRLLLPYFASRTGLVLATAAGLAAGCVAGLGDWFSLTRTLNFFPYFLLGHLLGRDRLAAVGGRPLVGAAVLSAVAIGVFACWPEGGRWWLYRSVSYGTLGMTRLDGAVIQTGLHLLALVTGAAFLSLVPRGRTPFTAWGAHSLYPFLLHGFPLLVLARCSDRLAGLHPAATGLLLACVAVVVTSALASGPVRRVTQLVVEPTAGGARPPRRRVREGTLDRQAVR